MKNAVRTMRQLALFCTFPNAHLGTSWIRGITGFVGCMARTSKSSACACITEEGRSAPEHIWPRAPGAAASPRTALGDARTMTAADGSLLGCPGTSRHPMTSG